MNVITNPTIVTATTASKNTAPAPKSQMHNSIANDDPNATLRSTSMKFVKFFFIILGFELKSQLLQILLNNLISLEMSDTSFF